MDERDSSTLNEDYWHSTYKNFCKCDQALFPFLGGAWGRGLTNMGGGSKHMISYHKYEVHFLQENLL